MENLPLEYVVVPTIAGAGGLLGARGLHSVIGRIALVGSVVSALLITVAHIQSPIGMSAEDVVARAMIVFTFTLLGAVITVVASLYVIWVRRVFRDAAARIEPSPAARRVPSNAE